MTEQHGVKPEGALGRLRFQIAAARTRPQETLAQRTRRPAKLGGIANGVGGWRPDPTGPTSYRYDGGTAIGHYSVSGDATSSDSAHSDGGPAVGYVGLELLFWGSQWLGATAPSVWDVIGAVQQILASPYLSELHQYGLNSINMHGVTVVTQPGPGAPTFSGDDVRGMVWDLIDDDVFPEPDEPGGQIIYMVFAPGGSVYNVSNNRGAHSRAHDTDLFDSDDAWVGWCNHGDLDFITDVFSHELAEAISNPNPDDANWVMNRSINGGNEIGDACNTTADRLDGLLLQAYWSEKDKACVIPWHRYGALLDSSSTVVSTATIETGQSLANTGPCQPPAEYWWWLQRYEQQDIWRVTTTGYPQPKFQWNLGGTDVSGNGAVSFSVDTSLPDATGDHESSQTVTLSYQVQGNDLWVTNTPADGNFRYDVTVTVTDVGGGTTRTTREMHSSGWVTGQDVVWEDAFHKARNDCAVKMKIFGTRMVQQILRHIDKGDPTPPWLDNLPSRLRGVQRAQIQELEYLAHYLSAHDPGLAGALHNLSSAFGFNAAALGRSVAVLGPSVR